ncbi:MAG: hypothetical protein PHS57_06440 [Alphaproteobacteria bacterium]|nr:hypothetical protein [Alphaproteobacteria bacterium]
MSASELAFLNRHGEISLQPLLERWERSQGIVHCTPVAFEARWAAFLNATRFMAIAA